MNGIPETGGRRGNPFLFFDGLVAKGKPNHKDQERPVHGPKLSGPLAMPEVGSPKGHRHLKGDWVRIYFELLFSRFILGIPKINTPPKRFLTWETRPIPKTGSSIGASARERRVN